MGEVAERVEALILNWKVVLVQPPMEIRLRFATHPFFKAPDNLRLKTLTMK